MKKSCRKRKVAKRVLRLPDLGIFSISRGDDYVGLQEGLRSIVLAL